MSTPIAPGRAESWRWHSALDLLRLVRRQPGITRAAAAQSLGLSSSSTTEITARLRALNLLDEKPSPPTGRGRPTTALHCCPDGPLIAVVDVRHEDWQVAVADVDGNLVRLGGGPHPGTSPAHLIGALREALGEAQDAYGFRLRGISVAVAGTVRDNRLVQASTLGWREVDFGDIQSDRGPSLPLSIGNDATLAGVAEARRGTARTARTVLYLTIEVGIGGVLVDHGKPVTGATGAGGEFGHLPFGDPTLTCPCGARGCWDLEVDGRAMARYRGAAPPPDPWSYAATTLAEASHDLTAANAVERCAIAFGRGTAGLVNALDPDVVSLGGFAGPLQRFAPDVLATSYIEGLMAFRRDTPPPLQVASLGTRGPLLGAADVAFDAFLTDHGLAAWSDALRR